MPEIRHTTSRPSANAVYPVVQSLRLPLRVKEHQNATGVPRRARVLRVLELFFRTSQIPLVLPWVPFEIRSRA